MCSLVGCVSQLHQEEWTTYSIIQNDKEYEISILTKGDYKELQISDGSFAFNFSKNDKQIGDPAVFFFDEPKEEFEYRANMDETIEKRQENNVTYLLLKDNHESTSVEYLILAYIEEKECCFILESLDDNFEEMKGLFNNIEFS